MALPRKLKHFNVFYNGEECFGQATEITLPKLSRKFEEYRGAGMPGPVDIDLGNEKLELEHSYGGLMLSIIKDYALPKADGVLLRFAGSYQRDDSADVDAVEVTVRGRHQEIDSGNAKAGDDTEFKIKSSLTYYKLVVNGKTLIEIDHINMIEIVNGVDRLKEHRNAIGR